LIRKISLQPPEAGYDILRSLFHDVLAVHRVPSVFADFPGFLQSTLPVRFARTMQPHRAEPNPERFTDIGFHTTGLDKLADLDKKPRRHFHSPSIALRSVNSQLENASISGSIECQAFYRRLVGGFGNVPRCFTAI
jgi:hypothetical protein